MKIINIILTVIFVLTAYTWGYIELIYIPKYDPLYRLKTMKSPDTYPENIINIHEYIQKDSFFDTILYGLAAPMEIGSLFLVWLYIPLFFILLGYHIYLIIKKRGNMRYMVFQLSVIAGTFFIFGKLITWLMD